MVDGADLSGERAVELLEGANDPIVVVDGGGTIVWANRAVGQLGWRPEDVVGRASLELMDPADVERALLALAAMADGHRPPSSAPFQIVTAEGGTVECDVAGWVPPSSVGAPEALAVHLRPTQDSRVLRELLQRLLRGEPGAAVLEHLLGVMYHRNPDVRVLVTFLDEDGERRLIGDALDPRLAGEGDTPARQWDQARATGEDVVVEDLAELDGAVAALAEAAGLQACWIRPVPGDDEVLAMVTLWVRRGGPPPRLDTYSMQLLTQLTELVLRWRRQTRELERAATRDPLTGLPNRRALDEFDAVGPRRDVGVLYIDLDRFKPINDRLGHAAGDQVLRTVANRLLSAVRPTDIVARLGGDEFGVVCPGCSEEELAALADRVHELLTEAIGVHGDVVTIGASIGAALGHDSVGPLLARADRALYDAKDAGRGTIRWSSA